MNPAETTKQKPRLRSHRFWYVGAITVVLMLTAALYSVSTHPTCLQLTTTRPQQFNYNSNEKLIALAHSLGATDPITTCSGDTAGAHSIDGSQAFVIKINNADTNTISALGCPKKPESDGSNDQNATYVRKAYQSKDPITGYYEAVGEKCGNAGDVAAILSGKTSANQPEVFIIFSAKLPR